jgi:DNA-binding beta-propeller fold protein YncE
MLLVKLVINHKFDEQHKDLWAPESGFYKFNYTRKNPNHFTGKPVESVFSHNGQYLWVPYYRRSYDLNAQDPSAMAVIDTATDTIVRLFETGPLPKMVAVSPDQTKVAVTHWGNNTVGMLDVSSSDPKDWKYVANFVVDKELKLNFSRTEKVDRDRNSGYCLRGTVFTPDGKYLLVGCMGGGGGIAVIEVQSNRYLGRVMGCMPSLRHLIIKNGYLFASINSAGYVQRIPLDTFISNAQKMDGETCRQVAVTDWTSCKVPAGARTIEITPNGKYIFAACNFGSALAVVDAETMKLVGTLPADSYPVGLDISKDGRYVFTTSQGRSGLGGNSVNIFEIKYL